MKYRYNVLEKVRKVEEKNGINYAKTDGKLYKTINVLHILAWVYTLGINILFLLGNLVLMSSNESLEINKAPFVTVLTATVLLIVARVIMRFKNQVWANIASGALNLIICPVLAFTFANLMEDSLGLWGLNFSFYWRHAIPLALIIIFGVWLTIIALRANIKTDKQYKKTLENIYNQFKNQNFSEEQWEDYLKNYEV